jgi:Transglycosylase SLT domain
VQNCNIQLGTIRNLNRRPDQHVFKLVFEHFVGVLCSSAIFKATMPVLFVMATWATVFSTQYSHDDAQVQLRSAIGSVRPFGALPDFLLPENASSTIAATVAPSRPNLTKAQNNLVQQLSSLYRVSTDELSHYVIGAYTASRELKVDPLLVLAIMSIESSFDPEAQSHAGAQGLMQVLTRVHAEKFAPFGGVKAAFDTNANIHVGTRIIKEYLNREGSIEGALKSYVGAALMSDDGGYGYKVMSQMERLRAIAAGKPIPNIPDRKPDTEAVVAQTGKAAVENIIVDPKAAPDSTTTLSPVSSTAHPIVVHSNLQTSGQVIPANFSANKQGTSAVVAEPSIKQGSQPDTATAVEL